MDVPVWLCTEMEKAGPKRIRQPAGFPTGKSFSRGSPLRMLTNLEKKYPTRKGAGRVWKTEQEIPEARGVARVGGTQMSSRTWGACPPHWEASLS